MIVEPKDDVVMESYISQEIHLQCELSRSSGKVRWFKDGQVVEDNNDVQLMSDGPYRRLTISSGSVEDCGEYVCETDGDSVFFQLTVKGKTDIHGSSPKDFSGYLTLGPSPPLEPPVRIISPSEPELELSHLASERLELSCEISQADAPVRWYRDGLEVEEGPNLILEIDGAKRRLVIPVAAVDDTGEYICDTEDDSVAFLVTITGQNDSLLLPLIVLLHFSVVHGFIFTSEPPLKLARPQNAPETLETFEGEPIVLEIEVSRANAEVKWRLDGREVQKSANVTVTKDGLLRRLTIRSPAPEDSGKYTCDAADDRIDFQVQVSGKWFPLP